MKKNKISIEIDKVFLLVFLYITAVFLISKVSYKLTDRLILAIPFSLFVYYILNQKQPRKVMSSEIIDNVITQFRFKSDSYTVDFLYLGFRCNGKDKKFENYLKKNNTLIVPFFREFTFGYSNLAYFYSLAVSLKTKRLTVLCDSADVRAKELAKRLPIVKVEILEKEKTFKLLKAYRTLPLIEIDLKGSEEKMGFSSKIIRIFNPGTSVKFFSIAVTLFLFSFVTAYSVYYIVFAVFLTIMSITAKLNLFERIHKASKKTDRSKL